MHPDPDTRIEPSPSRFTRAIAALSSTEQKLFWALFGIFITTSVILGLRIADERMVEVPRFGGTFIEGIIGFPRHINPVLARTDTDRDLVGLLYSGLLRRMPDGSYVPDLAESLNISDDGKTYTVTLKQGLRWHDGTEVTSTDIAFTISAIQDGTRDIKSPRRASWESIEVETPDQYTVVFILPSAYAPFKEQLTTGILPAHLWSSLPREQFDLSNLNLRPVGTGPMRLRNIVERDDGIPYEYVLEAFDGFALGRPYIDTMRIRFYGNSEELLSAYQERDIIAMSEISPELGEILSRDPLSQLLSSPLERVFAIYFNQAQSPVLSDKAVRAALDGFVNRDDIVLRILRGYGTPVDSPIPPGIFADVAISTSTPEERFANAQKILETGGWKKNAEGVYEKVDKTKKTALSLSFSIATGDTGELKSAAEAIALSWRNLGAQVEVKIFDKSTLGKDVITLRQYDALLYGAVTDRLPDLLPFWHSSQRTDPGLNIAMYANSKADAFLEEAREATSSDVAIGALEGFVTELKGDHPAVFLYSPSFLYATAKDVGGISIGVLATRSERFNTISEWYLKTERVWPLFASGRPIIVRTGT